MCAVQPRSAKDSPSGYRSLRGGEPADGSSFTLDFKKTGQVWSYSRIDGALALLTSQTDRNGNHLDDTYDGANRLTQIKQLRRGQTLGRSVTVGYVAPAR